MAVYTETDSAIQQHVLDELEWDPAVEVTDVGVEVDDGVVTLTGIVDVFSKKFAAEQAAFRVKGVRAVANDIIVQPVGLGFRSDTDIARAAATALELASDVPLDRIRIRVADGVVTLHGDVDWHYQRAAAERIVAQLYGVKSVTNLIGVAEQPATAEDIQYGIKRALIRNAELDADSIDVKVDGSEVVLTGQVRSWMERHRAEEAAWNARGVTKVINQIRIQPD